MCTIKNFFHFPGENRSKDNKRGGDRSRSRSRSPRDRKVDRDRDDRDKRGGGGATNRDRDDRGTARKDDRGRNGKGKRVPSPGTAFDVDIINVPGVLQQSTMSKAFTRFGELKRVQLMYDGGVPDAEDDPDKKYGNTWRLTYAKVDAAKSL